MTGEKVLSRLFMDRGEPLGNTIDQQGKQALHTKTDLTYFSNTSTSTVTRVNSSATSVVALAANANRKGAIFYNDSKAFCYLCFGSTASSSSYTFKMTQGSVVIIEQLPVYTDIVSAIWTSVDGALQVTELT